MKKMNLIYVFICYGIPIALIVVLLVVSLNLDVQGELLFMLDLALMIAIPVFVPGLLKKRMEKSAAAMEQEFPNINYKFTAHNCVVYLDTEGGHMGMVWKHNPFRLQMIDPAKITDIRTNDGQILRGTEVVSCQFLLDGKKVRIYTLRVSGGQLAMKHPRVMEAVSKADKLSETVRAVVQAQKVRQSRVLYRNRK